MFPCSDVESHVRYLIQDIANIRDKRWLRAAIVSHTMSYLKGKVPRTQLYRVEEVVDNVCQWSKGE